MNTHLSQTLADMYGEFANPQTHATGIYFNSVEAAMWAASLREIIASTHRLENEYSRMRHERDQLLGAMRECDLMALAKAGAPRPYQATGNVIDIVGMLTPPAGAP